MSPSAPASSSSELDACTFRQRWQAAVKRMLRVHIHVWSANLKKGAGHKFLLPEVAQRDALSCLVSLQQAQFMIDCTQASKHKEGLADTHCPRSM